MKEKDAVIAKLAEDIKLYLKAGGKIDRRKPGESVPVDATKTWPAGFSADDNVFFTKKGKS